MEQQEYRTGQNKYRAFTVEPCLNGFIVTIGCQRAVFQTLEEFAENLMLYAKDPDGVEKIWIDRALVQRDLPPTLAQAGAAGLNPPR